jgi:signal transduction histidine kinase
MTGDQDPDLVTKGMIDASGRLVAADPDLAALHARAGGTPGGPLAVPQIAALARTARELGITIEKSVIAADGDQDLTFWVRAQPVGDDVALTVRGWSKSAAQNPVAAPDSEREADFLRAAADWTWETDERLCLTFLSPAAIAAAGKPSASLIGKELTRLLRLIEDRDGQMPILGALAEQRRFDGQIAELRGVAKPRYRLNGVPLIDGAGRFCGFRGSATSIIDNGPEEPDPVQADPIPAGDASAFSERLGKALRGPLDQIIASAETIGDQPEGPLRRDYASYAQDIAAAGRHLLGLIEDLVDLQAIERPDFAPDAEAIDLADIARRAAGLLAIRASTQGVAIEKPRDDEAVPSTGEFKRVLQILVNLVSNAIRYSPEGGTVSIVTDTTGNLARVTVADEGKGIDAVDHGRIFQKFERVDPTEAGGTGLGLYIARRLARAMGGDIIVRSAPGQGARFTLTLPLRR